MMTEKIPVTVLTGFLGSGKTTLLRNALASPDMADTAVIINEAGEMGLDHLLVKAVAEQVFELPSGCLCCVRRTGYRDDGARPDHPARYRRHRWLQPHRHRDQRVGRSGADSLHARGRSDAGASGDLSGGGNPGGRGRRTGDPASPPGSGEPVGGGRPHPGDQDRPRASYGRADGPAGRAERLGRAHRHLVRMGAGGAAVREGAGSGKPAALRGADGRTGCRAHGRYPHALARADRGSDAPYVRPCTRSPGRPITATICCG